MKYKISGSLHVYVTEWTIVFLMFIFTTGCNKDWYDVKSEKNLTVPSSLNDFEYLLDNYTVMNTSTPALGEIGSDGHYFPESVWGNYNSPVEKNAYTWSYDLPYETVPDWNNSYKRIFMANLALEGLDKIVPSNSAERNQWNRIRGNALFHRAKNYFDLAQIWAQPYRVNSLKGTGLPLKIGTDVTEQSIQSTVDATYKQVVNDLMDATTLLPDLPLFKTRGSKASAFALLARTFLIMNEFDNALKYSDSSLNLYNELLDLNNVPSNNRTLGQFNSEVLFHSEMQNWSSTFIPSRLFIESSLYALYEDGDLRKSRFFNAGGSGITFKGMYTASRLQFTGLAVDEVYLIKAECLARRGSTDLAMSLLNELLIKRWNNSVVYPNYSANSPEEALTKIILERKKELLLRGIRWSDLRRLNQEEQFKVTLMRSIGGNTYTLEPDSYKYTFPLPEDVRRLSNMEQTPGW